MFKKGDRVAFKDEPDGTSISQNGRCGTVVYPNMYKDEEKGRTYTAVEWDEKLHGNDDGFSYVVNECLIPLSE